MELVEFLDKNRDYINFRGLEKMCGLSDGLLNKVIKGTRKLKEDPALKIIGLFDVNLTHTYSDGRKQAIPDLNKDGSFGDKWENYFRFFEHTSGLQYKSVRRDGKYYPNGRY